MSETNVIEIRKYQNRKLYDTNNAKYVSLGEILDYVRGGSSVKVLNKDTKENITNCVLFAALVELEKTKINNESEATKNILVSAIRSGTGTFTGLLAELL